MHDRNIYGYLCVLRTDSTAGKSISSEGKIERVRKQHVCISAYAVFNFLFQIYGNMLEYSLYDRVLGIPIGLVTRCTFRVAGCLLYAVRYAITHLRYSCRLRTTCCALHLCVLCVAL